MFGRVIALALVLLLAVVVVLVARLPGADLIGGIVLDVTAPIQELVSDARGSAAGGSVATIDELVRENQRLRAENERLLRETTAAPERDRELKELRELLGIRQAGGEWQWLEARVIGFDSSNLVRSVTLNRGTRDGIADGMTVMTGRGLVGKVVYVSATAVRVLLVSDATSSVNAMIQRSRAQGVLYGQRSSGESQTTVMRYIPQGEEVRVGDRVITSGLGGVFPHGVAIGEVIEVRQRDTDMFQEAVVEPYVELARLEKVFVIVNHIPVKLD